MGFSNQNSPKNGVNSSLQLSLYMMENKTLADLVATGGIEPPTLMRSSPARTRASCYFWCAGNHGGCVIIGTALQHRRPRLRCPTRLRVRAKISSHFGASAGQADARRCDAGDAGAHRRGAATKQTGPPRRHPQGGRGSRAISASLVVNDVPTSPPPHSLTSPREPRPHTCTSDSRKRRS